MEGFWLDWFLWKNKKELNAKNDLAFGAYVSTRAYIFL